MAFQFAQSTARLRPLQHGAAGCRRAAPALAALRSTARQHHRWAAPGNLSARSIQLGTSRRAKLAAAACSACAGREDGAVASFRPLVQVTRHAACPQSSANDPTPLIFSESTPGPLDQTRFLVGASVGAGPSVRRTRGLDYSNADSFTGWSGTNEQTRTKHGHRFDCDSCENTWLQPKPARGFEHSICANAASWLFQQGWCATVVISRADKENVEPVFGVCLTLPPSVGLARCQDRGRLIAPATAPH
jgi:hypothetical protein